MKTSASIAAIAAALAKAQGKIRNAGRDAANPFFKSKYAPLDTVIDNVKEALSENGIAYFQSATSDGPKVSLLTMLMHASGEFIEGDALTAIGKDAGAQTIGSVCTYLRRYGLMSAVGIAATDDDDAEAGEGRPKANAARQAPRQQAAAREVHVERDPVEEHPDATRQQAHAIAAAAEAQQQPAKPKPHPRAAMIWKRATDKRTFNMTRPMFEAFVAKTLGGLKPSHDWTDEDAAKLEAALDAMSEDVP